MTLYIAVIMLVLIFAVIGYKYKELDNCLFVSEMILLTLMLIFRYGQGSDYWNYQGIYHAQEIDPGLYRYREPLYAVINWIAVKLGWSYSFYIAAVGVFCMALSYRGISKLSKNKTFSVLLLLPAFYLTYYFSTLREGIVLAATLGIILPLILEKKKISALICILLASQIHKSSIIMLLMLPDIPWHRMRKSLVMVSAILGIGMWGVLQFASIDIHELVFSPSYPAVILRIVVFMAVTVLFEKKEYSQDIRKMYDIYLIGFCFYLVTFAAALFSQRGTAYFKIIEVILLPGMLGRIVPVSVADCRNAMRNTVFAGLVVLCLVEGVKNLASYPGQMGYPARVTYYNYPYISIFNKEKENLYRDGF